MAPVPHLGVRRLPMADAPAAELTQATAGSDRFLTVTPADLYHSAETCVMYRLTSLDISRRAERGARRLFPADLREFRRRSFHEMQLVAGRLSHFSHHIAKSRANANDPLFGDIVLPAKLRNFADDLSPMGAFLKPNHLMANYGSRELARGNCQKPSHTPYIVSDLSAAPWPVFSADHAAALAKWAANNHAPKPGAQPVPFHAWALYRIRLMMAADLCASWLPIGGLATQLNNLSIIAHLAATESIGAAIPYDTLLSSHLEELARARAPIVLPALLVLWTCYPMCRRGSRFRPLRRLRRLRIRPPLLNPRGSPPLRTRMPPRGGRGFL